MTIAENLHTIQQRIERAAQPSGRQASAITLVAVTKTVPVRQIREAIAAGVTHFGENRVQEAIEKYALPGEPPGDRVDREGITLHMIGTLQRNKARRAASLFDWIQSLDRLELAHSLEEAAAQERAAKEAPLPVLIEVNLTNEPTKSGIAPQELPRLADALAACPHLRGAGLMTIARLDATERELRQTFSDLRNLLEGLRGRGSHPGDWQHLSMGMSNDYELAIQEGATMVRLGRAIFGER